MMRRSRVGVMEWQTGVQIASAFLTGLVAPIAAHRLSQRQKGREDQLGLTEAWMEDGAKLRGELWVEIHNLRTRVEQLEELLHEETRKGLECERRYNELSAQVATMRGELHQKGD